MLEYHFHFRRAPETQDAEPYCFCDMRWSGKNSSLDDARRVAKLSAEMPHMGTHSVIIETTDGSIREVWVKQNGAWVQENV